MLLFPTGDPALRQLLPPQDIISQRLETLYQLPQMRHGVLIVPISTLMLRTAPQAYLDKYSLMVQSGQRLNLQQLRGASGARRATWRWNGCWSTANSPPAAPLLDLFPHGKAAALSH